MKNKLKIAVFAYNFSHKKTQDVILALLSKGVEIDCVLAANKKKLNFEPSKKRISVKSRSVCDF